MLQNGLSIAGVPSFWQQVVTGVILVLAVLGDHLGLIGDRCAAAGAAGDPAGAGRRPYPMRHRAGRRPAPGHH